MEPTVNYGEVALMDPSAQEGFASGFQTNASAFVYQIKGRPMFAFADIYLQQNQSIIADSSALLWLDGNIDVATECTGGCWHSYLRQCSGEPCCFNRYTAKSPTQKVAIGTELPGDVMAFGVTPGNGWVFTFDAFIAGTSNLQVSTRFSSCCACECADESPFMTRVRVKDNDLGVIIAGGYGQIERHDIPKDEMLYVSRGLFFAAHENTTFEVGLVGGCSNLCWTGGGIVMKFRGPCAVYTSSKNPVQLLRDFGIPGGKKANIKYAKLARIMWECLKQVGKAALENAGK